MCDVPPGSSAEIVPYGLQHETNQFNTRAAYIVLVLPQLVNIWCSCSARSLPTAGPSGLQAVLVAVAAWNVRLSTGGCENVLFVANVVALLRAVKSVKWS